MKSVLDVTYVERLHPPHNMCIDVHGLHGKSPNLQASKQEAGKLSTKPFLKNMLDLGEHQCRLPYDDEGLSLMERRTARRTSRDADVANTWRRDDLRRRPRESQNRGHREANSDGRRNSESANSSRPHMTQPPSTTPPPTCTTCVRRLGRPPAREPF